MLAKHALSQLSYGPMFGNALSTGHPERSDERVERAAAAGAKRRESEDSQAREGMRRRLRLVHQVSFGGPGKI